MPYETPEIHELGDATELTLGYPNRAFDDACDCTTNVYSSPPPV